MQRNFLIGYVILVHLFLLLVLLKTDFIPRAGYRLGIIKEIEPELTQYYETMVKFHERIDENTPEGAAIFIGDSCTQGLCTSAVVNPSVNFGIGGDTTVGVLKRLPKYHSLGRARVCVMAIGGNDLRRRGNEEILRNYSSIIKAIPSNMIHVFIAILPVDEGVRDDLSGRNKRTREMNSSLKKLCEAQSKDCSFVDPALKLADSSGNLRKEYHEGDGVHLNGAGYSILIQELRAVIEKARQSAVPNP